MGRQRMAYFVQLRKKNGVNKGVQIIYKKSADRSKKRKERERRCKIGKGARERFVQIWKRRVVMAGQPRGRS